jgi:hypothetical protein
MAAPLLVAVAAEPASAQKTGGILKMYSPDSPASMSIHEEATFVAEGPMMGVFNNLVVFDQQVKHRAVRRIDPGPVLPKRVDNIPLRRWPESRIKPWSALLPPMVDPQRIAKSKWKEMKIRTNE